MQFSLKWLFGLIAFAAVSCVALMNASRSWADACYWATFLLVLFTALAAFAQSGNRRAFSVGFALFGWAQLALLGGHFGSYATLQHRAPTTFLGHVLWQRTASEHKLDKAIERGRISADEAAQMHNMFGTPGGTIYLPIYQHFLRIFDCVMTVLLATVGGLVSALIYRREHRRQNTAIVGQAKSGPPAGQA